MDSRLHHGAMLVSTGLVLLCCGCSQQPQRGPNVIDPDAPTEFSVTESGLKYRILRKGSGPMPSKTSRVTVDYSGWLDNQTIFDSSYSRRDAASFRIDEVIPGWAEGMQLVREGGMIELEVPSELGYGAYGSPPAIPPGANLHFKVELHKVE